MNEPNEEAAVNALHVQHEYGDEDLKRDMKAFIVETIRQEVLKNVQLQSAVAVAVEPQVRNKILVNSAREIEKIVARYLTNKLSGDQY